MKFLAPLPLTIVFLSSRKREPLRRWLMWAPAENFKLILVEKMSFLCLSLGLREKLWKGEFQTDWRGYMRYFQGRRRIFAFGVNTNGFINSIIKVHFHITSPPLQAALLLGSTLNSDAVDSSCDTLISWAIDPTTTAAFTLYFSGIRRYILFAWHCPQFWRNGNKSGMVPALKKLIF